MDITSYLLSKKYTNDSLDGVGAVKGAPCRISKIEPVEGGNKIIFAWTSNSGVESISTLIVKNGSDGQDGTDGVSIKKIEKIKTVDLIDTYRITFSDNSTFDYDIHNGKVGNDGISPTIEENENNTESIYRLDITDKNGTFTTPNLKGKDGSGGGSSENYIHYGSSEYWNNQTNLISEKSHIYIYTDYVTIEKDNKIIPNIKIGDGKAYLIDIPFITLSVEELLSQHTTNDNIHVTIEEKELWNNKISCRVDENNENIIFFIGKDE